MATDINGVRPGVTPEKLGNERVANDKGAARSNQPAAPQQPAAGSVARAASDSVSLSNGAQALKAVQEKLQKLPEVNEKRVAQIKAALESGEYKVDELVIADKLLSFDDLFE